MKTVIWTELTEVERYRGLKALVEFDEGRLIFVTEGDIATLKKMEEAGYNEHTKG